MSHLVFDVESAPIANAAEYLEPATAPSNYVKPEAIAAYIEKANAEQLAKAALDIDLARIVALGFDDGSREGARVLICRTDDDERKALRIFWQRLSDISAPILVGFNCIGFDLPLMLRRSLYLGTPLPSLRINKYRHEGIEDLMLALSFDGSQRFRSLAFYAKRFGLIVPSDAHHGAEIPALVAAGDWDAVAAHCRCDLVTTVALARRMGVLS